MRAENKGGRGRRVFVSTLARWVSPVFAIAIGFYLGAQGPAYSQIESHKISAPTFSGSSSHPSSNSNAPLIPKAPKQVELPAPPPIKIFPGLEEPLVATGPVSEDESKDLDTALKTFHDAPAKTGPGGDYDDYGKPLLAFVTQHPQSNWNAALYLNIGLGYYHSGYYSRVFTYLDKAWQLGRNATSPQAHLMIDRAVGELAKMHARVGHDKELEALFADIGKRPIGGPATELIQGAHEGLWTFHHNSGEGYLCGPMALKNILVTIKANKKQIKVADDARSGPHGFSLTQLAALADKAKLKYKLVRRVAGQPIPVPSIINWNVHHYAAITGMQGQNYHLADPTFANGGHAVLTAKAIDAESSGYFLVPASVVAANPKAGWHVIAANSAEAKAVYGMGSTNWFCPGCTTKNNYQTNNCPNPNIPPTNNPGTNDVHNSSSAVPGSQSCPSCGQMCAASASEMTVSLSLTDTPVGYRPQIGPTALTALFYNQREDQQPATMGYSNVSPKWTFTWQAYVQDDPSNAGVNVMRYSSGGGGVIPTGYRGGPFNPEIYDNALMYRVPASGSVTSYTRSLPDGTQEVYGEFDGATTYPRRVFLTKLTDPQGNSLTLSYDSSLRVTSFTDAMGRSTTFTYGLTGYPLLITQITDPFGRTSQLTYDTSQRLSTITDPIGITSSFTYSTADPSFITQLTTPYGTSNFNDTPNPNDTVETATRSLTMTDPLGYTEFLYFYQNPSITPASAPTGTIPSGMATDNGNLQWRNTYHWGKHAAALGVTMTAGQVTAEDFTKATIFHWCHDATNSTYSSGVPCSIQAPLENRVWFNYPNQSSAAASGSINRPQLVGRVLDDASSQFYEYTYNSSGNRYIYYDPIGRYNAHVFATNNIDMSDVVVTCCGTAGAWTSYTAHRAQTYTDPANKAWQLAWNTAGQIHTITDPGLNVTTYNYDSVGRLSNIVNANSVTQASYTYDSADRIQTYTDSQGYVLTYAYDNLDRVTSITYPDGTTDLYDYTFQSGPNVGTPSLELRKQTDRLGRVTTYGYDADRRLTSVTEPTSGTSTRTTTYDYYEDNSLKDIIDANGNDTHYTIDVESRPTSKTYGYGTSSAQTETYAYENTISRLHSITDALAQVKTFKYAEDNRITGITYTNTVNPTPNVTFTWDPNLPELTSMTDGTGTTHYSYATLHTNGGLKLSSIAGPYTNGTVGLSYDALSRLTGRTVTGGNETFGYDSLWRINSHVTPLGTFTLGYLGQTGQSTSQSVTNGSTTVSTGWSYDTNTNDRRLIGITNSGVTRSYTLSYLNGSTINPYEIMSITDTAATGHPWATQARGYTYDLRDRVLTASSTTPGNDTYAYDNLDNATTYNTPASGSLSPTYNVFNQLATFGSLTYSYDANGNTTGGDGIKTYKYDAENRLIEIDYVGTSNKSVFAYDGLGHRISDAETVSGTTTTTYYEWCPSIGALSGQGVVAPYGLTASTDAALVPDGLSQALGGTLCQTRNSSQAAIRRDLPEGDYNVSTTQKLIYMPDQLDSVRDVLDGTTGSLVQSYDYTPYGAVARSNGSTPSDFQYAGLFAHPPSGLSLATNRALDGVTGRWINRDPIKEDGGINLYAYVDARPTVRSDPNGLEFGIGGGGYVPFYPDPHYVPPYTHYSETDPGFVCSCIACKNGVCGSVTENPFNVYGGPGSGFGNGCSIVLTNNMQAYSSGRTYSGGFGDFAFGGNSDSIGIGGQTPGIGGSVTYSVPIFFPIAGPLPKGGR
jgi:RHS repeat-associated protein